MTHESTPIAKRWHGKDFQEIPKLSWKRGKHEGAAPHFQSGEPQFALDSLDVLLPQWKSIPVKNV